MTDFTIAHVIISGKPDCSTMSPNQPPSFWDTLLWKTEKDVKGSFLRIPKEKVKLPNSRNTLFVFHEVVNYLQTWPDWNAITNTSLRGANRKKNINGRKTSMATIAIDVFATNNNFKQPIYRTPSIEVFPSHLQNASSHTGSCWWHCGNNPIKPVEGPTKINIHTQERESPSLHGSSPNYQIHWREKWREKFHYDTT